MLTTYGKEKISFNHFLSKMLEFIIFNYFSSCSSQEYESPSCFSRKGSQNRSDKTFAKRPSFIAKSEAHNQNKKVDLEEKEECVLGKIPVLIFTCMS